MATTTIQFFHYDFVTKDVSELAKKFYDLAHDLEDTLPDSAEKSAGMRKLLEAKDCFVRAQIQAKAGEIQ